MNNDPAVVVASDGSVRYRASALGSCTRALVAIRQEYATSQPPERMQEIFAAGHAAEEIGYSAINARGGRVTGMQDTVVLKVSDRISVVGHIDGILDNHVLELKSQSANEWNEDYLSWGLWSKYAWQLSVYMHALRLPAYLMQIRRLDGKTLTHEMLTPPRSLAEIRMRVLLIEHLATGEINGMECDRDDYPCPVFYTHAKVDRELLTDEALEMLIVEHEEARVQSKRANDRRAAVRDAIIERLGMPEMGKPTKIRVGKWNVSASRYAVKERTMPAGEQTRLTITEVVSKGQVEVDDGSHPGTSTGHGAMERSNDHPV